MQTKNLFESTFWCYSHLNNLVGDVIKLNLIKLFAISFSCESRTRIKIKVLHWMKSHKLGLFVKEGTKVSLFDFDRTNSFIIVNSDNHKLWQNAVDGGFQFSVFSFQFSVFSFQFSVFNIHFFSCYSFEPHHNHGKN